VISTYGFVAEPVAWQIVSLPAFACGDGELVGAATEGLGWTGFAGWAFGAACDGRAGCAAGGLTLDGGAGGVAFFA
jgi:hypothetical protein